MSHFDQEESNRRRIAALKFCEEAGNGRYSDYKFSTWKATTDRQKQIKAKIEEWADTYPDRKANANGLILYGTCGTGKDHLAFAAVRKVLLTHSATAMWKNGRELFGQIRDNIDSDNTERSLIRQLAYRDILVISDPLPVVGGLTNFQSDMLYRIVDARYAEKKLTVVTINVSGDKQGSELIGAPTWDRLRHNAWVAKFDWQTERKPALVI